MITIREALEEMSPRLGEKGLNPNSDKAMRHLNRARKLLYPLDDWLFTTVIKVIPCNSGCFFPPYEIESIRSAWEYCGKQADVSNAGYRDIDPAYLATIAGGKISVHPVGTRSPLPVQLTGNRIAFRAKDSNDNGKTVVIRYTNSSGSVKTETIALNGEFLWVSSDDAVMTIHSIRKEKTIGEVEVGSVNKMDSPSRVHTLNSRETNPEYRQYESSVSLPNLVIRGKRKFENYDSSDMDEPLDVDSLDALEFASIALENKSTDINKYQANLAVARTHLDIFREDFNSSSKGYEPMIKSAPQIDDRFSSYSS